MPIHIEGDYVTVGEAARILGVSQSAVSHAIAAGRLKAEKVGPRGTLIERSEVMRYGQGRADRGWDKRRAPGHQPGAAALRMRESRARRKRQQHEETPATEARAGGEDEDGAQRQEG